MIRKSRFKKGHKNSPPTNGQKPKEIASVEEICHVVVFTLCFLQNTKKCFMTVLLLSIALQKLLVHVWNKMLY